MRLLKLTLSMLLTFCFVTAQGSDKLAKLRSSKKIISMETSSAPYYAIQIVALREAPTNPSFFKDIDEAREYECTDGFLRFCVGSYNTKEEALADVDRIKGLGYDQAFVVNTSEFALSNREISGSNSKNFDSSKIDPNKTYTVQVSAFRYPVYLTFFKGLENVMEFRLNDKIFRYTVGSYRGSQALRELETIRSKGFRDAHLVELEKYLPYKIE